MVLEEKSVSQLENLRPRGADPSVDTSRGRSSIKIQMNLFNTIHREVQAIIWVRVQKTQAKTRTGTNHKPWVRKTRESTLRETNQKWWQTKSNTVKKIKIKPTDNSVSVNLPIETEDNEINYTVPVKQGRFLFTVTVIKNQKQHVYTCSCSSIEVLVDD